MGDRLGVYPRLMLANIRSQLQYPVSFWLDSIGQFVITFAEFLTVVVLFHNIPRLAGWSIGEVAYLYGTASVTFALTDAVVGHLDTVPNRVRNGTFDLVLLRPLPTLLQVIGSEVALKRIGKLAQGLVVLAYALSKLGIDWTPTKLFVAGIVPIAGGCIFAGIWLGGIALCFWMTESREIVNAFTYGGNFASSYPLDVFAPWLRRLFTFVIPIGFAVYYPALYVLGRPYPRWAPFASPVVGALVLAAGMAFWRFAVRHYRSTGS